IAIFALALQHTPELLGQAVAATLQFFGAARVAQLLLDVADLIFRQLTILLQLGDGAIRRLDLRGERIKTSIQGGYTRSGRRRGNLLPEIAGKGLEIVNRGFDEGASQDVTNGRPDGATVAFA